MNLFQSSPSPGAGRCIRGSKVRLQKPRFQSSPSPGAGRCMVIERVKHLGTQFQSSPSPGAGRCRQRQNHLGRTIGVSILAQPGGRALPIWLDPNAGLPSFNPRPARGPGAASVAASPSWSSKAFQSSPSPGAGRCENRADVITVALLFQSSPSPGAGRCLLGGGGAGLELGVSILAQPGGRALPIMSRP